MDSSISYLSSADPAALDARPPVLVAAASAAAHRRAAETIAAAGFRIAEIGIDGALARLARQASASALWIELDDDGGDPLDRLIERANADAAAGLMPAIIAAPRALLDPLAARLDAEQAQLLIDATAPERATALALATAWRGDATLHDVTGEPSSVRLRQLSDEVGRIAVTLARLSSGVGAAPPSSAATERPDLPEATPTSQAVSGDIVRGCIRARRLRARYFDPELFADPAWDMLLDLLAAEIAQHRVPVSSLCIAASVPPTTALRWIKTMTDSGLFLRRSDPHDGRRIFVELSPGASDGMRRYFAEVQPHVAV
ncbi:MAG: hypothetical protein ABIT69_08100 [Sphingomicrobium sp.]